MLKLMGLVLVSALLAASPTAWADANGVKQSPEIFYPNSAPRGDFVFREGDVFVRLPILWASAARLEKSVTLNVDGKTRDLAAGVLLPATQIMVPGETDGRVTGYCTPKKHGERDLEHGWKAEVFNLSPVARAIAKALSGGQFCLFESGTAGGLDELRYFGSENSGYELPVKIEPVPFVKFMNAPVLPSDQNEIRLIISNLKSKFIKIDLVVIQDGRSRKFNSMATGGFSSSSWVKFAIDEPLPKTFQILGIDFQLLAFDPVAKSVTIRYPTSVDQNRVLVIPEDTAYQYCSLGRCSEW